jgi:hypothetical protein
MDLKIGVLLLRADLLLLVFLGHCEVLAGMTDMLGSPELLVSLR